MALVYLVALKIPPSSVSRGTINKSRRDGGAHLTQICGTTLVPIASETENPVRDSLLSRVCVRSQKQNKNKKGSATRELGMHATSALSLWHCITPDHAAAGPVLHDVV
ncbi:hypothetical protein H101_07573 [Trichophyton interdigitale H6]|nr:hypothetical protein H101_07573 [Trichophyton interdigitale H6]